MKLQRWHKRDIVIFFACLLFVALVVSKHLAGLVAESGPGATIFGLVVCAFVFPFLPVRALIFGYGRVRKWRDNRKGGDKE